MIQTPRRDIRPAVSAPIPAQPEPQPSPVAESAAAPIPAPEPPDMAEIERLKLIGAPYALRTDRVTGKVLDPEPAANTVKWWGLQLALPHWLVEAMAVHKFPNEEITRVDALILALATAKLPLGKGRV